MTERAQRSLEEEHLLLFLLTTLITIFLALRSLGLLSPDTAWTTTPKRRGEGKVDMLLRIETDDERWDVDNLLSDAAIETR